MLAGRMRIIVLGEAADTRELFEVFFAGRGLDARAVATASDVLRVAREWSPNVVLVDISNESLRTEQLRALAESHLLGGVPFITTLPLDTDESQMLARALDGRLVHCRQWDLEELFHCVTEVAVSSGERFSRR